MVTRSANSFCGNESSCLTKLSVGKRKFVSKASNINVVPMIDLTEDLEDDQETIRGISKGIPWLIHL